MHSEPQWCCDSRVLGRTRLSKSTTGAGPTLVEDMQRLVQVVKCVKVDLQHNASTCSPLTRLGRPAVQPVHAVCAAALAALAA